MERMIYRLFEILPGAMSWFILLSVVLFSWKAPVWVAVFIICFDLYWLFRTAYFSFHLRCGYQKMKEYQKIDWEEKLDQLKINRKEIYHLIVLPIYKEPLDIIRESLKSLENSDWPKDKMIVVLGCEERVKNEIRERQFCR